MGLPVGLAGLPGLLLPLERAFQMFKFSELRLNGLGIDVPMTFILGATIGAII